MGLLRGVVDKLDLAQPPRRLGALGGVVTFLPAEKARINGPCGFWAEKLRGGPCPHPPGKVCAPLGSELPLQTAV